MEEEEEDGTRGGQTVECTTADEVEEDDIVFCQVQPGNRFYAHIVKKLWTTEWNYHGEWAFHNFEHEGAGERMVPH